MAQGKIDEGAYAKIMMRKRKGIDWESLIFLGNWSMKISNKWSKRRKWSIADFWTFNYYINMRKSNTLKRVETQSPSSVHQQCMAVYMIMY